MEEKREENLRRCASERRTKVNPSMTRRYEDKCRRNQMRRHHLGRTRRVPDDWAGGDRRKEGVKRMQAIVRNCRNQGSDVKGEAQAAKSCEARVPKRGTGADYPVVTMKRL